MLGAPSVWAKLEALAAEGDRAKFTKCPCDESEHAGWTLDPAKEERIDGKAYSFSIVKLTGLVEAYGQMDQEAEWKDDSGWGSATPPGLIKVAPALLEKNATYQIPHSAEDEKRRFEADLEELGELAEGQRGLHRFDWSINIEKMDREAIELGAGMEELVWHFDPRLQLIHFPSFRCFVEVQFLKWNLNLVHNMYQRLPKIIQSPVMDMCFMFNVATTCVPYYLMSGLLTGGYQWSDSEEEEAGPSLTKTQKKRAKRKAKKLAARQAKEEAKASDATGSSRSDYLPPMMPAPKPPTAAPKKKKAGAPKSSSSAAATGEAAGGSWAVVESGVEGLDESQSAQREPSKNEPLKETKKAAKTKPTLTQSRKESPETPTKPEAEVAEAEEEPEAPAAESEAPAPVALPVESVAEPPVAQATPVTRVTPQLPLVEAVGPSGAYAVLSHDLARIADRLRQARLARSAR